MMRYSRSRGYNTVMRSNRYRPILIIVLVLLAAFLSAVTKPFGVHGVFWKTCGHGVAGIDGFYTRSSFAVYHELALVNPDNAEELCEELYKQTGIPVVYTAGTNDVIKQFLSAEHDEKYVGKPIELQRIMRRDWDSYIGALRD